MEPELKTPAEWSKDRGITILDPDGWRRDNKSMDEPITEEDYERRVIASTTMGLFGRPRSSAL